MCGIINSSSYHRINKTRDYETWKQIITKCQFTWTHTRSGADDIVDIEIYMQQSIVSTHSAFQYHSSKALQSLEWMMRKNGYGAWCVWIFMVYMLDLIGKIFIQQNVCCNVTCRKLNVKIKNNFHHESSLDGSDWIT